MNKVIADFQSDIFKNKQKLKKDYPQAKKCQVDVSGASEEQTIDLRLDPKSDFVKNFDQAEGDGWYFLDCNLNPLLKQDWRGFKSARVLRIIAEQGYAFVIDTTNILEFYKVSEDGQIERVNKGNVPISKTPYVVPSASDSIDTWYCFNNNRQEKEVYGVCKDSQGQEIGEHVLKPENQRYRIAFAMDSKHGLLALRVDGSILRTT